MNDEAAPLDNYFGKLPEGWTGGEAKRKWFRGAVITLFTLQRNCAQCHRPMTIDVTREAIEGTKKNAGLHLKRCEGCRDATKALGTHSRPHVSGDAPTIIPDPEAAQLRTANATMKEELAGLYADNRELRARLEKYEPFTPVQNGTPHKMPWEL